MGRKDSMGMRLVMQCKKIGAYFLRGAHIASDGKIFSLKSTDHA